MKKSGQTSNSSNRFSAEQNEGPVSRIVSQPTVASDLLRSIISKVGTPVYIYNADQIQENVDKIRNELSDKVDVYFATMANDNREVWRLLLQHGVKLFIGSMRHLRQALDLDVKPEQMLYVSTSIPLGDLKILIAHGLPVVLNSWSQVDLYGKLAQKGDKVGIRINMQPKNVFHAVSQSYLGESSRFGISIHKVIETIATARKYGLRINGLHFYPGTEMMDPGLLVQYYEDLVKLAPLFPDLEFLDFGGGFGVNSLPNEQDFDWKQFGQAFTRVIRLMNSLNLSHVRIYLEPGRGLLANTGSFLTQVTDIIRRENRLILGTDASVAVFPRPLMVYDAFHDVEILGKSINDELSEIPTDITGCTVYSRDYLARDRHLPSAKTGDVLRFKNAGAYCFSMITRFLGVPMPPEVLTTGSSWRIIRSREPF